MARGLRLTTAGESHGPAEVCILEGVPYGLELSAADIDRDLARRQRGYGRGGRMKIEADHAQFLSGVRLGKTLGSPIALLVENADHANWRPVMQPEALPAYQPPRVTVPRPGHADLAGAARIGTDDIRDVLERSSARETVARVAGGAVARRLIAQFGVEVRGRVVALGPVEIERGGDMLDPASVDWESVEASSCAVERDEEERAMRAAVDAAREEGESLGGVFEVWAWGMCPGLGGYERADDRLDGRLMQAVGSIPAIKGVEIGDGFALARQPGSSVHDPIVLAPGRERPRVVRLSNRSGGLEGGMTTGAPLVVRAAMKPIPTLMRPLPSVDLSSMEPVSAHKERSDVEAVAAARVVGEAAVCLVIASAYVEKFGGDSLADMLAAFRAYVGRVSTKGWWGA
jgi:chorismate synthase